MPQNREPEHYLVRYTEKWAPSEGTIAAHQSVLAANGSVWVAKFGRGIGRTRIAALQEQIDSGVPTFLVLLNATKARLSPHSSRGAAFLLEQVQEAPPARDDSARPIYYRQLPLPSATWFRATTCVPLDWHQIQGMRVPGGLANIMETLASSWAGGFRLTIAKNVFEGLESS